MIKKILSTDHDALFIAREFLFKNIPHEKDAIAESIEILKENIETDESDLVSSSLFGFYEKEKLLAVCGLYSIEEDAESSDWVNWFAVDPLYRRLGIANSMLSFLFNESKKMYLKVYTTLHEKIPFWEHYFIATHEEVEDEVRYFYFKRKLHN